MVVPDDPLKGRESGFVGPDHAQFFALKHQRPAGGRAQGAA